MMVRAILSCATFVSASAQDIFLAFPKLTHMEPAAKLPAGWERMGSSPGTQMLELTFAVKQQNVDKLQEELLAVSTPSSLRYGKHLTNQEVHDLVAPRPEDISAVLSFLESHGVKGLKATPNGDMIAARVSVSQAEQMLAAQYVALTHADANMTVHRAIAGYQLPSYVAAAVDFVSPTVHIPGAKKGPRVGAESSYKNVPKTLRRLYSLEDPTGGEVVGKAEANKMAVTAFLKQYYDSSDLKKFWSSYCDGISCGNGLPKLVGTATTGSAQVESMLDIETITGMVGNVETEFWGFSGTSPDNPENEPFMQWLSMVSSTSDKDVPLVFSTSYAEDENSWSATAAQRLNTEFMKTGARGISLLYASGDLGANCVDGVFVPFGPGSSPWVTAVGGTGPTKGYPAPGSETAVSLSTGGFSDYHAMPAYQKDVVATYLKQSGLPDVTKYKVNVSGRAYPDIAAQAVDFCVTAPGVGCDVDGTSCATPTASGIIGALNDARLAAGKSSLGFLNPLLYSLAGTPSFQDITTGSGGTHGLHKSCDSTTRGWPAKEGWDAVTGLGTLNYKNLVKAVLDLP